MGWASERQIEEFNARYESDAEFRRAYDEAMREDAMREAYYFRARTRTRNL